VVDVSAMPQFEYQQSPQWLRMIAASFVVLVKNEINIIGVYVTTLPRARFAQRLANLVA
jgi:hypothetical protein